jgi:hypothetical protein
VPHFTRGALAHAAGIPEERIVFHPTYIGGDFGGKGVSRLTPIAYYLAKASGRPVRMISDYLEEFLAGNPRHRDHQLKTGVKRDGTITAHQVNYVVNSGAYAAFKPFAIGGANQGRHRIPNCGSSPLRLHQQPPRRLRPRPRASHRASSRSSRRSTRSPGGWHDPAEFRLQNLIVDGEETPWGEHLEHVRARRRPSGARRGRYNNPRPPRTGRGVAIGERGTGGGGRPGDHVNPDGSVSRHADSTRARASTPPRPGRG